MSNVTAAWSTKARALQHARQYVGTVVLAEALAKYGIRTGEITAVKWDAKWGCTVAIVACGQIAVAALDSLAKLDSGMLFEPERPDSGPRVGVEREAGGGMSGTGEGAGVGVGALLSAQGVETGEKYSLSGPDVQS